MQSTTSLYPSELLIHFNSANHSLLKLSHRIPFNHSCIPTLPIVHFWNSTILSPKTLKHSNTANHTPGSLTVPLYASELLMYSNTSNHTLLELSQLIPPNHSYTPTPPIVHLWDFSLYPSEPLIHSNTTNGIPLKLSRCISLNHS